MEDSLDVLDFSKDGGSIFLKSSIGSDTQRVVTRDIASGPEANFRKGPGWMRVPR